MLARALKVGAWIGLAQLAGPRRAAARAAPAVVSPVASAHERARLAYAALQAQFFVRPYGIYRDFKQTHPRLPQPYASNWSFSVAARAALALARLPAAGPTGGPELGALLTVGLERYWDAVGGAYNSEVLPPLGIPFGPDCFRFYDDNAHDGLLLLEYAAAVRDPWALERAGAIFTRFLANGLDRHNPTMAGGVKWAQTPHGGSIDRNLVSSAPSALLALQLHRHTGDPRFVEWAVGVIGWCDRYLRDGGDGLYWDKIRADGTVDRTKWSYNQGFMVGAYTALYEITRDPRFLAAADHVAGAALAYHRGHQRHGIVGLLNQDPDFNAVFFRYATRLLDHSADGRLHRDVREALRTYADQVWNAPAYHRPGHLFALPCDSSPLRMQAAMVEIYALQAAQGL